MFTNEQIAQRFISGETSGKSKHMLIYKDIVYSYDLCFPVVKRLIISNGLNDEAPVCEYLFNSRYYSPSTARHQACIDRALSGKIVWRCTNCDVSLIPGDILISLFYLYVKYAKSTTKTRIYMQEIGELKQYWAKVKNRFTLKGERLNRLLRIKPEILRQKSIFKISPEDKLEMLIS